MGQGRPSGAGFCDQRGQFAGPHFWHPFAEQIRRERESWEYPLFCNFYVWVTGEFNHGFKSTAHTFLLIKAQIIALVLCYNCSVMQSTIIFFDISLYIIPAIATTNAIIAGLIVMEAYKIINNEFDKCRSTYPLFLSFFSYHFVCFSLITKDIC